MSIKGIQKLYTRTVYLLKVYPEFSDELLGSVVIGFRAVVMTGEKGNRRNISDVPVYEDKYGKYFVLDHDRIYLRNFEMNTRNP